MKNLLSSIAVLSLMATASFADNVRVNADANADAFAASGSESSVSITSPDDITVRSAPDASAPSMSSGHPCAYSGGSFGISIIGGGASAGGMKIDDACLLAQMGERGAAVGMIAARNPAACKALRSAGRIAASSVCGGDKPAKAVASTKSASRVLATCEFNAAGKLTKVVKKSGVDSADAVAFCRAK